MTAGTGPTGASGHSAGPTGASGHGTDPVRAVWHGTRALRRAVLFVVVLVLAGLLFARPDLVLLAAPVALGSALSLGPALSPGRRARPVPSLTLSLAGPAGTAQAGTARNGTVQAGTARNGTARDGTAQGAVSWAGTEPAVAEGLPVTVTLAAHLPPAADHCLLLARIGAPEWVDLRHGTRPRMMLAGGGARQLSIEGFPRRWGLWSVGPAVARVAACDGLLVSDLVRAEAARLRVYPVAAPFDADDAMPRAAGMVGQHRSRRAGTGGEIDGVRRFGAGDQLRRVDWRATLRSGHPHVVATLSDRDAEVVLLLDVLHETGVSQGVGGSASVLDTTVRAAAAIADHYLHLGDRVSLLEYGRRARWLRPAGGHRQYLTVLEWLLTVSAEACPYDPAGFLRGVSRLPGNALILALTPLLDERSTAMLARLARSGRYLVAVDTLRGVQLTDGDRSGLTGGWARTGLWTDVARRLWLLERENTIAALRGNGVPVVEWTGAGSLNAVLRDVARLGSAPRAVHR